MLAGRHPRQPMVPADPGGRFSPDHVVYLELDSVLDELPDHAESAAAPTATLIFGGGGAAGSAQRRASCNTIDASSGMRARTSADSSDPA